MQFNFSIRRSLRESWELYKHNALFFTVMMLVIFVLRFVSNKHFSILSAVVLIAALVWAYATLHALLDLVYHRRDFLSLRDIHVHFPTIRQFFGFIGVSILSGAPVVASIFVAVAVWMHTGMFVALPIAIILGLVALYGSVRLSFGKFAYVNAGEGVMASLRASWHLVRGRTFWITVGTMIVAGLLIFAGALLLLVGMFITYPLAMLLLGILYRELAFSASTVSSQ